ncbi:MAG: RMD1 family protein, partial [Gammaproteobacteria bacterium]|nr:RMD1 family protein [Gammaproteobacteria bacterium]
LFRYGAVVLFNVGPFDEANIMTVLNPLTINPLQNWEMEELHVLVDPSREDGIVLSANEIIVSELGIHRVQLIADILAKSVALDWSEKNVSSVLLSVEPLAKSLESRGRVGTKGKQLMQIVGGTLHMKHQMIGRVEVSAKPEFLWEDSRLERDYNRLEDEYELIERQHFLERKLEVIGSTTNTAIELMRHHSSLRVEWYITVLIIVEIVITLVEIYVL